MTVDLARTLLRCAPILFRGWVMAPAIAIAGAFALFGVTFHAVGELDWSVWESADAAATRSVPFICGAVATPLLLPVLVAHGVTRRRFAAVIGALGAVLAAAAGFYMAAGFLVEKVVYATMDLPQELRNPHLFDTAGQVHLVFAEHALLAMAYLLGGWLIGTGYYGYGGWRGTGLLLPGALVPVATDYVLGTGWVATVLSQLDLDQPDLPLAAATALAIALIALGIAAGRALIGTVPIRTRSLP